MPPFPAPTFVPPQSALFRHQQAAPRLARRPPRVFVGALSPYCRDPLPLFPPHSGVAALMRAVLTEALYCYHTHNHRLAHEAFFRSVLTVTGSVPDRVTTDGHSSYPGAIKAALGEAVTHRTNRYVNKHLEQDHRGIKQRTRPMGGFKRVVSAARFYQVYDEVRNFFRVRSQRNEPVSLAWQRTQHLGRIQG